MTNNLLIHAYVDGELDPAHALELEGAIAADAALAAERDRVQALRDLIGERLDLVGLAPATTQHDRRNGGRQSLARPDGAASDRCQLIRSPHREAMV